MKSMCALSVPKEENSGLELKSNSPIIAKFITDGFIFHFEFLYLKARFV